jgi:phosphate:Na+ symporter
MVILGGVALILHGVRTLRKGLDRLFGAQLGPFLQRASGGGAGALFTGVGMSLLAPSSTSVSVLAVQAVRSGHVTARRMLLVLLGADIGLTFTVQLLSLKIELYAPAFLALGVLLYQYTRNLRTRGVGQVFLSFGFLFLGIGLVGNGSATIDPRGDFGQILKIVAHNPFWLATVSAILAIAMQSSTATVGLLMGLSAASSTAGGLALNTPLAIAAVAGANVGVGFTMLMIAWGHLESRRLAVANLMAKCLTAAIVLALLPEIAWLLRQVSAVLPRQVADAHTGFNLFKAMMVLPMAGAVSTIAQWIVPAPRGGAADEDPARPRYLGVGPADGNSLALSQSMREILRVAEIVRSMCDDVWRALREDDEELIRQVSDRDNHVDKLEAEIKRFLANLDAHSLDPDQATERLRQLRYLSEMETIGDLVDKNLCELALKKIRRRVAFTPEAWQELEVLDRWIVENMLLADAAFHTGDLKLAAKLLRHKDHVDRQVRRLRDTHLASLDRFARESPDCSAVQLDLLTNLRRINSHVCHIAFALLGDGEQTLTASA